MNATLVRLAAAGLVSTACSGTPVSKACSDEAYLALSAECGAAVGRCRISGGSPEGCGAVCDAGADDWIKRCGQ